MLKIKTTKNFFFNSPSKKIFFTFLILFIYRFCNTIPLSGIDQEALKQTFLKFDTNNSIIQILTMYSGGGGVGFLSPFSLGIIPFINASIFIDLLTAIVPSLEKLQTEEGELGRRKLLFFKKLLTLVFSIAQSIFLIFYLKSYIYDSSFFNFSILIIQLTSGTMLLVWLSNLIDNKGIGNGTSILILVNILMSLINKNIFNYEKSDTLFVIEIFILFFLMGLICLSQTSRITIDVVSARQLGVLEKSGNIFFTEKRKKPFEAKENGLSVKFNQAGIFPIIIASNILPFLSYFLSNFIDKKDFPLILNLIYYFLIIGFNYFYTIVFWDPEKISEQLRKASVCILNVTPGQESISYLENVVRSSSFLGGIFLCLILVFFDFLKTILNAPFLNQINLSSLIIVVGVGFEIQKTIRSLYKNILPKFI